MKIFYISFIIVLLIAPQSFAFSTQEMHMPFTPPPGYEPLEVSGNAVSWKVFNKTEVIKDCGTDEEGFDYCDFLPGYSDEIKAINGKRVTLMGFMYPLDPTEAQRNFLLGPYPLSCPFEYHAPPSQVVEVNAESSTDFSYDPVTVSGILDVRFNKETGVFYYLKGE